MFHGERLEHLAIPVNGKVPLRALGYKQRCYKEEEVVLEEQFPIGQGKAQWYIDQSNSPNTLCNWKKFDDETNTEIEMKFKHFAKSGGDIKYMCFSLADGQIINVELMVSVSFLF